MDDYDEEDERQREAYRRIMDTYDQLQKGDIEVENHYRRMMRLTDACLVGMGICIVVVIMMCIAHLVTGM